MGHFGATFKNDEELANYYLSVLDEKTLKI